MEPETTCSSRFDRVRNRVSSGTRTGFWTVFRTRGNRLMEQQMRFSVNTPSSARNHQEWYMSKN